MRRLTPAVLALLAAYVLVVVAANWAVAAFNPLALGAWILIPHGVWFVALELTIRDFLHDRVGGWWTAPAIVAGAAISLPLAGANIAGAAVAAFLISPLVDAAVYGLLRRRTPRWAAVLLSNAAGLVVDTVVFIGLAAPFFRGIGIDPSRVFVGQLIGKTAVTLVVAGTIFLWDRRPAANPPHLAAGNAR
ncbi:VUT family protein [Micromonospora sp. NPDC005652]|uniref:VUT family protein n=1 Tax=Micromonospora sp. NPDC005652 TaxID=3157046 RepID=UPI0034043504